jgi:hypothetical protein
MQEHIRRAHPEHYISKLPATEESFLLMINTPPSERPPVQQQQQQSSTSAPQGLSHSNNRGGSSTIDPFQGYPHDRHVYKRDGSSAPGTPRNLDEYGGGLLQISSAAAALAQLHGPKHEPDWDSEGVSCTALRGVSIASSSILLTHWSSV